MLSFSGVPCSIMAKKGKQLHSWELHLQEAVWKRFWLQLLSCQSSQSFEYNEQKCVSFTRECPTSAIKITGSLLGQRAVADPTLNSVPVEILGLAGSSKSLPCFIKGFSFILSNITLLELVLVQWQELTISGCLVQH